MAAPGPVGMAAGLAGAAALGIPAAHVHAAAAAAAAAAPVGGGAGFIPVRVPIPGAAAAAGAPAVFIFYLRCSDCGEDVEVLLADGTKEIRCLVLERQRSMVMRAAAAVGLTVVGGYNEGRLLSAGGSSNFELQRMAQDIKEGKIKPGTTLVIERLDRLGRRVQKDQYALPGRRVRCWMGLDTILGIVKAHGLRILTCDGLDTDIPGGWDMLFAAAVYLSNESPVR